MAVLSTISDAELLIQPLVQNKAKTGPTGLVMKRIPLARRIDNGSVLDQAI